jgi:hypothetical protein
MARVRHLALKDLASRIGPARCGHGLEENLLASEPSSAGI